MAVLFFFIIHLKRSRILLVFKFSFLHNRVDMGNVMRTKFANFPI